MAAHPHRPQVYAIDGVVPVIEPGSFVHPSAVIIGDVLLRTGCYVGPHASLRGDMGRIVVGAGSNIQDGCIVHGFPGGETVIGENSHIAHGAVIHGCILGANVLVGMNAVVMDEAEVGESAFVAAMALVPAGRRIPPGHLAAGVPARVVRELTAEERAWKRGATAEYQHLTRRSLATLRPAEPLAAVEPDRPALQPLPLDPLHRSRR
ncbi:gamma carbonic anhydrase family protein [Inmirania thermothiophila]|uniref:Phenylacetic acid degradation protein n=1 Tax=Inmirania thermothiophila TaxID=1750597 RepID=A0A3N1Y0P1_9GAMM|nr:phenylacetic acid degradation protein PaaY [Inmirania thermothiophila]ROR32386.1 phenylacetic acid degradation protein [Inmirania thermothiophila]